MPKQGIEESFSKMKDHSQPEKWSLTQHVGPAHLRGEATVTNLVA